MPIKAKHIDIAFKHVIEEACIRRASDFPSAIHSVLLELENMLMEVSKEYRREERETLGK